MSNAGQDVASLLLGGGSAYMKARQAAALRQQRQKQQSQGNPSSGAQAIPQQPTQPSGITNAQANPSQMAAPDPAATQTAAPSAAPSQATGAYGAPGMAPPAAAPEAPVQSALSQSAATAQPALQTTASGADSLAAGSPLASGAPGSVAGASATAAAPTAATATGATSAGGGAIGGALGAADAAGAGTAAGIAGADAAGAGAGVGAADAGVAGAGAAGAGMAGADVAAGAGGAALAGGAEAAVGSAAIDAAAGTVAADVLPVAAAALAAEKGGYVHPMAHPQHPMWPLLHHVAGVRQQGIPVEHPKPAGDDTIMEQQQPQGPDQYAQGGLVQTHPPQPANFGGARPPPGVHMFANGGPVRGANATPVVHQKRQAMPVGPNSGIVPASTEGQVLTMANGGPVPGYDDGGVAAGYQMMQPTSPGNTPMIGRAAGLAQGFTSGVATGHNLAEMWQQHEYRNALADQAQTQGQVMQQGLVAEGAAAPDQNMTLHDHVNHFFSALHDTFLGHDQDPEMAKAVAEHQARIAARTAPPAQGVPAPAAGGAAAGAPAAQAGAAPAVAPVAPVPGAGGTQSVPLASTAASPPGGSATPDNPRGAVGRPGAPPAQASDYAPATSAGAQTVRQAAVGAQQSSSNPAVAGAQTAASPPAVAAAISSPETKTGTGETPPKGGENYSLGPTEMSRLEAAKTRAAVAAARAGLDPTKVYAALSAQQNAAFQGQYLRNIGAANTALMNNDQKGVEDALRSASYYIPNGQRLNLRTATQDDVNRAIAANPKAAPPFAVGDHIVQNPFYGLPGHAGEQQQVPITPLTLSNMAQAALHPENFATEMYNQYKIGISAQSELQKAAAYQTGMVGRWMQGDASLIRQQVAQAMFPANYAQTMSKAELERAQASEWRFRASGQGGGSKITAGNALAYSKQGQTEFDNQAQGQLRPAPPMVPDPLGGKNKDGTPMMVSNPHAGQPQRDPTTVSPVYRGLTPAERQQGGALAQQIAAANIGDGMAPGTAAEIAARVQIASRNPNANHKDADGKLYPDLVISHGEDGQPPHVSVWDGHRYMQAWTSPNILPEGPAPGSAIDTSGGNTGGGGGEPPEAPVEEPPT
jgi:hypothetical protein